MVKSQFLTLLVSFWLLTLNSSIEATPINKSLNKRYVTTWTAPSGYRSSWGIDKSRLSFGAQTGQYITRKPLSATTLGQDQINQCSQFCEQTKGCGFFHPVLQTGSSDGNVVCALYKAKVSKSSATFTNGSGTTPGKVVNSYGFTRSTAVTNPAPASSSSSTSSTKASTSTSTTKIGISTSSSSTAAPTSTGPAAYPAGPNGGILVQFKPCEGTKATVPMFVNSGWAIGNNVSIATRAYITTHGAGQDFNWAFSDVYPSVGSSDNVLISPVQYLTSSTPTVSNGVASNWYRPDSNLAWSSYLDTAGGSDAIAPTSGANAVSSNSCSSYDIYDSLMNTLADKTKYPSLQQINIIGHSNGGATTTRYSVVAPSAPAGMTLRFTVANSPSFPYWTGARPMQIASNCPSATSWLYDFRSGTNRYVSSKVSNQGLSSLLAKWVTKDVRYITGNLDTYARYTWGDQSCGVQAEGGVDRRDRNYAHWAYLNLLAGTGTDVSAYYGYNNLTTLYGGVQSQNLQGFAHQSCIVDGVGHVGSDMWNSACGQASLFDATLPAGSPPTRP